MAARLQWRTATLWKQHFSLTFYRWQCKCEMSVLRHVRTTKRIYHEVNSNYFWSSKDSVPFKMATPLAHHEIAQTRYSLLKDRTEAFCAAFLDLANNPPEKILNEHFTTDNPKITEHGPEWANERLPFLGETFVGRDACLTYFQSLAETLEFIPNEHTFPSREGIIVDDRATVEASGKDKKGVVSVVGQAKFKAVETGQSWDEQFIYRLSEFDEDGKIGHWEIWADPLSAWVAVAGQEKAV